MQPNKTPIPLRETLHQIANGEPAATVLSTLCIAMESLSSDVLCAVLVMDDNGSRLRIGAAPSLPKSYNQAIDGISIGPKSGSCGTAVHSGKQIICTDIEQDPLWKEHHQSFSQFGIRGAWSTPILDAHRKVLGIFSMYCKVSRRPTVSELSAMEGAVDAACIVIERYRDKKALLHTTKELERARNSRREFFSTVEHELRTPLHSIIGYADLLKEELAPFQQPELNSDVEKIRTAGGRLLDMVNGMIEVVQLETGNIELSEHEFDLNDLIQSIITQYELAFDAKQNELEVNLCEQSTLVRSDPQRIRYVLECIVDNANKFTAMGKIAITTEHPHDIQAIDISVKDTGIGMNQQQIDSIFEYFVQADSSWSRRFEGSGLSLALSARFCKLLKSEISIKSELGMGSTFTVRIPL